jgi:opacity protein-like surface antigen
VRSTNVGLCAEGAADVQPAGEINNVMKWFGRSAIMVSGTGVRRTVFAVMAQAVVLSVLSSVCVATEEGEKAPPAEEIWSRQGSLQLSGVVQMLGSDTVTAFHGTMRDKTDSTVVYGVALGGDFTDHFNLNTELLFGGAHDTFTEYGMTTEADSTIWLWNLNLDYNVLKGRLTPFVTGGIGFFGWSGEGFAETNFSYNVGAGGRWDITKNISLRVFYRFLWTTVQDADAANQFNGVGASLSFMFK